MVNDVTEEQQVERKQGARLDKRDRAAALLRRLCKTYVKLPITEDGEAHAQLVGAEKALKAAGVFTYEEMGKIESSVK